MTHFTCRLTAKNRDLLRNPMIGIRVWATFFAIVFVRADTVTRPPLLLLLVLVVVMATLMRMLTWLLRGVVYCVAADVVTCCRYATSQRSVPLTLTRTGPRRSLPAPAAQTLSVTHTH